MTRGRRRPVDLAEDPRDQVMDLDQFAGLAHLATQPDQHAGGDVGVIGEPGQDPFELDVVLAPGGDAAPPLVGDREHAVDVGEVADAIAPSRNRSATARDVLAEQFTALMTAT